MAEAPLTDVEDQIQPLSEQPLVIEGQTRESMPSSFERRSQGIDRAWSSKSASASPAAAGFRSV